MFLHGEIQPIPFEIPCAFGAFSSCRKCRGAVPAGLTASNRALFDILIWYDHGPLMAVVFGLKWIGEKAGFFWREILWFELSIMINFATELQRSHVDTRAVP